MPKPFSYQYYKYMLSSAASEGYKTTSFAQYKSIHPKTVIMRHDVDYTLNGVLQMAQIEAALNVSASYLFRVHAHEYNLFTPHVFRLLKELQNLGHEIGLHFEATNFARALNLNADVVLKKEKELLELIIEGPVRTTSEHRDISHVVHNSPYYHELFDPHDAGFEFFTMEDRFFKEMKYLSDSNGIWREGDLISHLGRWQRFQVLTHPDWWFEDDLLLKGPYFHGLGN